MKHLIKLTQIIKQNCIFCISVTGALILHLVIAWLPLYRLEGFYLLWSNGPLIDDSYIFFSISRDLVAWFSGCLPSFQLSSGFQPLIAFFYTPFFHLFWDQKELPIHVVLSLNAFIGFFANISLYVLLRNIVNRTIATFLVSLWIWSPYVMLQTLNGMETILALLLLLITLNYYWSIKFLSPSKSISWAFLGLLIGIGFWARVDFVMIGFAIVLDQTWLVIQDEKHSRFVRLRNILVCSLIALAIASPWIIFTVMSTGNFMPISGSAVRQITSIGFKKMYPGHIGFPFMMFSHFIEEFLIYQPLAALSGHIVWKSFITGLTVVGVIVVLLVRQLRVMFRPIWILQALLLVSYLVFIGGFWHLNRYLYSFYTLMLLLHAATLNFLVTRYKLRQRVVNIIFFLLFAPFAFSYTMQYHSSWTKNLPPRYLSGAVFAKENIPPKVTLATFQSGCLGYWLDNRVINLDGVMNEKAYFHLKHKTLGPYMDEQKIDYFVDEVFLFRLWDDYLDGQLSKRFTMVKLKKNDDPQGRANWGVYRRKQIKKKAH